MARTEALERHRISVARLATNRTLNVAANVPSAMVLHDTAYALRVGDNGWSTPEKRANVHLTNMTATDFLRNSVDCYVNRPASLLPDLAPFALGDGRAA